MVHWQTYQDIPHLNGRLGIAEIDSSATVYDVPPFMEGTQPILLEEGSKARWDQNVFCLPSKHY